MEQFEKQGGVAFFLIYYTHRDLFYYLPYEMLRFFWDRAVEGGRKSFRFEELNPEYVLPKKNGVFVPYLDILSKDLEDRELASEKIDIYLLVRYTVNSFMCYHDSELAL